MKIILELKQLFRTKSSSFKTYCAAFDSNHKWQESFDLLETKMNDSQVYIKDTDDDTGSYRDGEWIDASLEGFERISVIGICQKVLKIQS